MSQTQQATQSLWQETETLHFSTLKENLHTEVCIVGAGISGLTTAYLLLKKGLQVIVVEKDNFGENETALSTAHISNALDDRYTQLLKWHGLENTRLAYQSHTEAIELIAKIVRDENLDCDFTIVDGYLFLSPQHQKDYLEEELKAAHSIGFTEVSYHDNASVSFFETGACLRFPNQAQFNPLKYIKGLAEVIKNLGGKIYTQTRVIDVKGGDSAFVKSADGFQIFCNHIVVATNVPINDIVTMHTKEAAYRSYVIGVKIPRGFIPPTLYWDTMDPYHYVRTQSLEGKDYDILIVGGEDHRVGQCDHPEVKYSNLKTWTQQRLGILPEVLYRWSGQIIEPIDGLAYIGKNPGDADNVYIVSSDSGHGITHGTIAGIILTDLITQQTNRYAELYSPHRFNWKCLGTYARENFKGTLQYADWLAIESSDKTRETLAAGEGAIVNEGVQKVAIYRDQNGNLHEFSAACPHLKGVVRWNSVERTWDCPLHGSRFSKDTGEVLNGPACKGLSLTKSSTQKVHLQRENEHVAPPN